MGADILVEFRTRQAMSVFFTAFFRLDAETQWVPFMTRTHTTEALTRSLIAGWVWHFPLSLKMVVVKHVIRIGAPIVNAVIGGVFFSQNRTTRTVLLLGEASCSWVFVSG